ncbi:MAG: glycosyltransferase [Acidimicrobiia bacterium]|nr:glycosyltransferase [Acidimicrobiia bacterium]
MPEPLLSIVIPTWNQFEFTRACVESLRHNTDVPYELIIVDNGSEPAAATAAAGLADEFVGNDENLGFAKAMNQGLWLANGSLVAFVNNDTEFPAKWASRLAATIEAETRPGIVLPAVTAAGNQSSVRTTPTDRTMTFPPFTAIPSGVVYLMERNTIVELGGWNEGYGIASAEDLDLLFTVWSNGLSVVLDERVLVSHASAVTAATLRGRHSLYQANRLAFAKRWAAADPLSITQLSSCPDDRFAANLEKARIAGTWMKQWFEAKDQAAALAAPAAATAAPLNETTAPTFIHRIRARLRRD